MFRTKYNLLHLVCVLFAASCSADGHLVPSPETVLVGSTPGDATIKAMLSIDPAKKVDFIRWHIVLNEGGAFVLNARYGVGKPNTPDFEDGGEKLFLKGRHVISKVNELEVYKLTGVDMPGPISIARLNDNVFHILSSDGRLMVGTGGWGYMLSRMLSSSVRSAALPSFEKRVTTGNMTYETVYVGRTPCIEIAAEYKWPVGDECFKLKWKLVLYRDPNTGEPTTYELQRTLHRPEPIKGKWTIMNSPKHVVYRLDPDKPDISISFLI